MNNEILLMYLNSKDSDKLMYPDMVNIDPYLFNMKKLHCSQGPIQKLHP